MPEEKTIYFEGKSLTQAGWDKERGYCPGTVNRRMRAWSGDVERVLTTPIMNRRQVGRIGARANLWWRKPLRV